MKGSMLAVDIGMTNIDIILETEGELVMQMLPNKHKHADDQLKQALDVVKDYLSPEIVIGVTGGRYRNLPDKVLDYEIAKVDEIQALGSGGLALSGLESGLVVSGGTGVAMVSASGMDVKHVTGSAVGGGTLLALSKLILGTTDVQEIDVLASAGDASAVDIMLSEAVGGKVGLLPSNANAVNLGKLDRENGFTRENLAAGLVRLVAQVIAVIAINAANASDQDAIIMVGHLMDLKSIRREIDLVGEFYRREFIIPENPGFGSAMGVLLVLRTLKK